MTMFILGFIYALLLVAIVIMRGEGEVKLYRGKWFIAIRFKNDLCVGVGKPSTELREEVVQDRPHRGI